MNGIRNAKKLSMILLAYLLAAASVIAEDHLSDSTSIENVASAASQSNLSRGFDFWDLKKKSNRFQSRIDLPRRMRVSHSSRSLRQVTFVDGDRLLAECLDWGSQVATFRLLSGQTISVPVTAVARMAEPPGEVTLVEESFELGSPVEADPDVSPLLDETQSIDGRRSLRIKSRSAGFRRAFDPPLTASRIEFSFKVDFGDQSASCGEWLLERMNSEAQIEPIIIRVESGRSVSVVGIPVGDGAYIQRITLTEGWHSFTAITTSERCELILDQALLAKFPMKQSSMKAIAIRPPVESSTGMLWIDGFHVHRLIPREERSSSTPPAFDADTVELASGDTLFGRLLEVAPNSAAIEILGQKRLLPSSFYAGLAWQQPKRAISQSVSNTFPVGFLSKMELQSFADRPECEAEQLIVTIVQSDSDRIVALHSLIGELTLRWSEIARIEPLFFGQSILLDARQFHLGNSIRSDFVRQRPDGTEIQTTVSLPTIPTGRTYLSLRAAELEAAGRDAPIASPFLAELRAGKLTTEVFVNDSLVGTLNSLLRFKARAQHPERIRLEFPHSLLKVGQNLIRLKQKPRSESNYEYDDCEIDQLRLEFDLTEI